MHGTGEYAAGLQDSEYLIQWFRPYMTVGEGPRRDYRVVTGIVPFQFSGNVTNQQLVEFLLARRGYVIDVANNGLEGIEKYTRGDYDLVLMDCQMPEVDGFEATRRIRMTEVRRGRTVQRQIAA